MAKSQYELNSIPVGLIFHRGDPSFGSGSLTLQSAVHCLLFCSRYIPSVDCFVSLLVVVQNCYLCFRIGGRNDVANALAVARMLDDYNARKKETYCSDKKG